jgi:ribose transport system substrate-binding protein
MFNTALARLSLPLLGAALLLSSCTNKATEGGAGATNPTSPPPAAAAPQLAMEEPPQPQESVPTDKPKREYRVGVSLLTQDDEFYRALKAGMEAQGKERGIVLEILSGDKDLNKQINQVQNFIAKKVDAIILSPVDSAGIISAVQAANAAKIPVLTADITSKGGEVACHVASDNVEGGRLVGEYAGKLLNGKGNIAILNQRTVSSVQDRVQGFREALAKFPDIKIVADEDVQDGKRENAVNKATNILTAHPNINLIFGINDPVALGTLSALQQANKTDVIVLGFDAVPEAQNYIASGTSPLKGDAIQFPRLIGLTAVDATIRHLNGEPVPKSIPVPTGLVSAESFKK